MKSDFGYHGSWQEVLRLAIPMVISNASWTLQHFVDRMFLSWYSITSVQAVMPAGICAFTAACIFIGLAGYSNTFVAQYDGAGAPRRIGAVIWHSIYIAIASAIILIPTIWLAKPLFEFSGNRPEVVSQEIIYFRIMMIGAFLPIVQAGLASFYTGRGKTWTLVMINVVITAVNLVLDYAMIFGRLGCPEMGIAGAAWATIIAEVVGLVIYLILLFQRRNRNLYGTLSGWRPDRELLWRMIRFGLPNGVQVLIDVGGFTVFILLLGRLSDIEQAATNIAFTINNLSFMPMLGVATAVTTLVGKYIGMGKPEFAARATINAYRLTCIYMVVIGLVFVLLSSPLYELFRPRTGTGSAQEFAKIKGVGATLLMFIAFYNFFDAMNFVFASALRGAGDTKFVMWMLLCLSSLCFVVPSWIAIRIFNTSIYTMWTIATIYLCILGSCFYLRYRAGYWQKMRVIEM